MLLVPLRPLITRKAAGAGGSTFTRVAAGDVAGLSDEAGPGCVSEAGTSLMMDAGATSGAGAEEPPEVPPDDGAGPVGVTAADAVEATLEPIALMALTVKVYAVSFVSPLTMIGELAPVATTPPGLDVTS